MASGDLGSVSVDVGDLLAQIQDLGGSVRGALREAAQAAGFVIEGGGKEGVIRYDFIDTGATLNSIYGDVEVQGERAEVRVGPTTEYAIYGEMGTRWTVAKPFMQDALKQHRLDIEIAVAEVLCDAIARAAR